MTAIRELSTMFASMFSLVLFMTLFESRLSKKKTMTLTLTLMVPLMILNFVMLVLLGPVVMGTLLLVTCSLPSMIFFFFLAKYRDGRFFFTFCFADTLILEIIDVTSILDFYLGNTYLFMLIARLIACPLLAFAVCKWLRPVYLEVQHKVKTGWYLFSAIALLFYIILSMAVSVPTHITQRPEQLPVLILLLILMPMIYVHIFRTLLRQQEDYERDKQDKILQLQADNMRQRIEEYNLSDQKFRMERHDFRHKLQTIATLIDSKAYESARDLVQEYTDTMHTPDLLHYCDHPILDAVLANYLRKARAKGIRISTKLSFPEHIPVSEAELATVFANALDNAISACEPLETCQKYLEIIVRQEPCFMFQIVTAYEGTGSFDAEGIPVSTKKGHGFGTRSIAAFCSKNRAHYEFKADGTFFALRVSFH